MIAFGIIGTLAILGLVGHRYRRSLADDILRRFDRSTEGIILGAEPIQKRGTNGAAVLLVHGGGDTPQTLRHVVDAFSARGYTVAAPLLPGHGRNLAAFDAATAESWYRAVADEFEALKTSHGWVGVIGMSMGGALAARLSAETQRVDALVLASPYLSMPSAGLLLARSSRLWGAFFPAIRTASDRSVFDPAARAVSLGYGAFTDRSLRALRETAARGFDALPAISAPTLVIQSTTDNRVSSAATERAFARIGVADKRLEWIKGAGHVITVDYGWQRVVDRMLEWMESHRTEARKPGRSLNAPVSRHA